MSVIGTLVRRYRDEGLRRIYECRRCGTSLDADAGECSQCGSTSIATYEL